MSAGVGVISCVARRWVLHGRRSLSAARIALIRYSSAVCQKYVRKMTQGRALPGRRTFLLTLQCEGSFSLAHLVTSPFAVKILFCIGFKRGL